LARRRTNYGIREKATFNKIKKKESKGQGRKKKKKKTRVEVKR